MMTIPLRRGGFSRVDRAVLLALSCLLVFALGARAQTEREASAGAFAQALVQDLATVANDVSIDEAARERQYRDVLRARLAVDTIGRFLFAGAPDKLATDEERARFETLFPDYIAAAFATEIGELAERRIEAQKVILRGENEAIVQSLLLGSDGKVRATIDWRIRFVEEAPFLLDVLVERVSPLVAKRQEFSAIARRDGVDALLDTMEATIGPATLACEGC